MLKLEKLEKPVVPAVAIGRGLRDMGGLPHRAQDPPPKHVE